MSGQTINVVHAARPHDGEEISLGELIRRANVEHDRVLRSAEEALIHAVRAGEALLAAKEKVQRGWRKWLEQNFEASHVTAYDYMRLAYYKEQALSGDYPNYTAALRTLRQLPAPPGYQRDSSQERRRQRGRQRRKEAAEALKQIERDRAIKEVGNERVAEAYFLLRRTSQAVDLATREVDDPEIASAMEAALSYCHRAEDEIVRVNPHAPK